MENITVIISMLALILSIFTYRDTQTKQKIAYRENLKKNCQSLKYDILRLENKKYTQSEIELFVEKAQDTLLYLCDKKNKKNYLSKEENKTLSELQENIEDYIGLIMTQNDIKLNKDLAKNLMRDFIEKI